MQSVAIMLILMIIVGVVLWRHDQSLVNEEKEFVARSNCRVFEDMQDKLEGRR